jgi:aminoglycoside/choline kinase family phosphotransferase
MPVPAGPHEITRSWLLEVLRDSALLPPAETIASLQTTVIGQDRGFTGVIARVQFTYAHDVEAALSSVVVKLPLATREVPSSYRTTRQRDPAVEQRYFERCAREVAFYQHIAPQILSALPRVYYGVADPEERRVVMVLEDLLTFRPGDALQGCSVAEAASVIDWLARLHARWWQRESLETFSWLPQWGGDAQEAQERYARLVPLFLQRFRARLPEFLREMIEALIPVYGMLRTRLRETPTTLVHGDLHLDNIFFPVSTRPAEIRIIDWQGVARGRAVVDLTTFLFGSLANGPHRETELALLHRYHALLVAEGVTGYSFAQLLDDCRLALLWHLGTTVTWLGSVDSQVLQGRERAFVEAASSFEELGATLVHYDAATLLTDGTLA